MCTIGAIRISQDEYYLFKNKDFSRSKYRDRIIQTDLLWGAEGLETFSARPDIEDVYSGLSIGANKHGLFVADSHVRITDLGTANPETSNYDILVEIALKEGQDIETALVALEKRIASQPSWWGNHQHLRGANDGLENNNSNSYGRFEWAATRLKNIKNIRDIKDMLASHDAERTNSPQTGICNHTYSQTVCSYILHYKQGQTTLHSLRGQPCLTDHYFEQELFSSCR